MSTDIQIGGTVNQPLRDLELRREELFRQIENLGDFRRGIISVNYRKCGKSNCACARKGHPGHGPQYLWNVSVGGKTQARNLPLGPELEKVQQEVERYQSFVRLSQELIAVNDQICQLRPARTIKDENELEQLKKKRGRNFVEKRKRKRPAHGAGAAGSRAAGTPGSGSQRDGHSHGHASDGGRALGEAAQQRWRRLPRRPPRLQPGACRRICGLS